MAYAASSSDIVTDLRQLPPLTAPHSLYVDSTADRHYQPATDATNCILRGRFSSVPLDSYQALQGLQCPPHDFLSSPAATSFATFARSHDALTVFQHCPGITRLAVWTTLASAQLLQICRLRLIVHPQHSPVEQACSPYHALPVIELLSRWTASFDPTNLTLHQPLYFNHNPIPPHRFLSADPSTREVCIHLRFARPTVASALPSHLTTQHAYFRRIRTGNDSPLRDPLVMEIYYSISIHDAHQCGQLVLVHALFAALTSADEILVAALDQRFISHLLNHCFRRSLFSAQARTLVKCILYRQYDLYCSGLTDPPGATYIPHESLMILPLSIPLMRALYASSTTDRSVSPTLHQLLAPTLLCYLLRYNHEFSSHR